MSLNTQELLQPSLKDWKETKSYDINSLFYVSFFGGIIPTIVLGSRNAKWLDVNKKLINIFILIGIIILLSSVSLSIYLYSNNLLDNYSGVLKIGSRFASIGLYLCYYLTMKRNFKKHMALSGGTQPMLKAALIWIAIGIIINTLLVIGGFYIVDLLA